MTSSTRTTTRSRKSTMTSPTSSTLSKPRHTAIL
nr:MAG TPA: hypothetical protein [Caudoviricetes sp.]